MVRQQSKIIKKLQNTAKAQVVPEWWRLVPVEPTKEMFAAGYDELENSESIELIYKRMISASPACGGSSEWVSVFKERPQKIEGNKIWATDGDAPSLSANSVTDFGVTYLGVSSPIGCRYRPRRSKLRGGE